MEREIVEYLMSKAIDRYVSLDEELKVSEIFGKSLREIDQLALKAGLIPERYRRNQNTFTAQDQLKFMNSTVAVIGCGGLGGYVIEELARLGIGIIKAVDRDVFEEHNLNRQLLSNFDNLKQSKTQSALSRIQRVNPAVQVITVETTFNEESSTEILRGVDVVVDALDSVHTRLQLVRACRKMKVPLVHGSIGGWYGQVSVMYPEDTHLETLFEGRKDKGIETELGNPAFTPAVVASLQAVEVCKILLGIKSPLRKKLLIIDLREMTFRTLGF